VSEPDVTHDLKLSWEQLRFARRAAEASEKRVGVLQQLVADLAAAPTEAEVAEAVVWAPGPAFGAAGTSIWLVDSDREQLAAAASTEPHGAARDDIPLASSRPLAEVARTSRSWPARCGVPAEERPCCSR
jgi:serine/threonine-protein kinase RsbW